MIQSIDTALAGSVTSQTQCPNCGHKGVSGEAICTQCGQSMYSRTQGISDDISAETNPRNIEASYETSPAEWEEGSNRSGVQAVSIEAALSAEEQTGLGAMEQDQTNDEDVSDPTDTILSQTEQDDVRELQDRDLEVRRHEQDHISAGGGVVQGSASYTYETGPDGKQYAVGGEVSVDVSSVPGDPDATLDKAQDVRRSALAPASPSAQDQNIAAKASQMEAEARAEQQDEDLSELEDDAVSEKTASDALSAAQDAIEQKENTVLQPSETTREADYVEEMAETDDFQKQLARYINSYV